MLPAQRQAQILEHLRKTRFGALQDIADVLGVSLSTARRDVDLLCEKGHLERTHGGAALRENERTVIETGPEISRELARDAKQLIARYAAGMVESGQTLILDSGSTNMAVAEAISRRRIPLTVFTNDLAIATVLGRNRQIDTHLPPGHIRHDSTTLLGAACYRTISRLRVDLAFLGAHAISIDGASETSTDLAEIKTIMYRVADRTMLVADSGKFGQRALCLFSELQAFDVVITDDGLSSTMREECRQSGALLEIAA